MTGHPVVRAGADGLVLGGLFDGLLGGIMSKLRSFFASKPIVPAVDIKSDVELDNELYLTIARQFGKENESVRNLLIDAESKIKELDTIKRAIGEQVDPVSKTLRSLEDAKSELSSTLQKVAILESECARLRDTLTVTQQKLTALETTNADQTKELSTCRAHISELKGRVSQQSGEIQTARDENRHLSERVTLADKQKIKLEEGAEATRQKLDATRQKLITSETDRTTVQKSLDKTLAEMTQVSQRLLETERAFEDAKRNHEDDIALHVMNYEALKTRAELTSKLLEDTRKNMLERAKEIQSSIAA
jgi:crescentin